MDSYPFTFGTDKKYKNNVSTEQSFNNTAFKNPIKRNPIKGAREQISLEWVRGLQDICQRFDKYSKHKQALSQIISLT